MKVQKDAVYFVLKKFGLLIVVLAAGISLFLGTFYESVVPKIYSAKSQILVSEDAEVRLKTMQAFDLKYIGTYSIYMYTDEFLMDVQEHINLKKKYSISDLKDNLQILISENSQIISVQFFADNKHDSIYLANLIAKKTVEVIPKKLDTYKLTMVSQAKKAEQQTSLAKKQFVLILFLMFVVLEILIIVYVFCFNENIYFKKQIEVILDEKKIYEL